MPDERSPLLGRRILVTGGATGIGAAAVHVLTEAGAAVTATYHRTPPPADTGIDWLQCDARDADAVTTTVRQAVEGLGGLDVLQIKATIPLGGALGDPVRDLGPMLVFLAGQGSAFITGQLLAVDGGLLMVGG
jgi:NAD(P)-dependent dehydrogenase (short-subunit alcohol dehydrogenase family)